MRRRRSARRTVARTQRHTVRARRGAVLGQHEWRGRPDKVKSRAPVILVMYARVPEQLGPIREKIFSHTQFAPSAPRTF